MEKVSLFLFDVDGVLVDPIAYRLGVRKTLDILFHTIGVSNVEEILPTEEDISRLESVGVHDVWDMTNILFAEVLCSIAFSPFGTRVSFTDDRLESRLQAIATVNPVVEKPSIDAIAQQLSANPTGHPPDVLSSNLIFRFMTSFKGERQQQAKWSGLLISVLLRTRDAYTSYATRLFQNIILGSDEFVRTYQLDSQYTGPSLLKQEDKALISEEHRNKLDAATKSSNTRIGIYTARPSHPPQDATEAIKGYSPEAELALDIASMTSYPLVGMGMMDWLASQKKERSEDLTKPNTTQAFAAVLACIAGETTTETLEQAYAIDKLQMSADPTPLGMVKNCDITIFVFEDTISGIMPMFAAAKRLNSAGYSIRVMPLGIARDTKKKAALQELCTNVFADVNTAIDFALES